MSVVPVILSGRQAFDPRATLFAHNEAGVWYDPSDLGTMFTTSDGTTPVTAVEQAVGLILDKSRGLSASTVLSAIDQFAIAAAGTTPPTAVNSADTFLGQPCVSATFPVIAAGSFSVSRADSIGSAANWTATADRYRIYYTVALSRALTTGEIITVYTTGVGGICRVDLTPTNSPTTWTTFSAQEFLNAAGGERPVIFAAKTDAAVTVYLRQYTVERINGTHAIQPTAASRPVLRNRYNLLTFSEQFDNAAWTKSSVTVSANSDTAPDGTTTADTLAATGANGTTLSSFTALAASYTFLVWLKRKTGTGNIDISAHSGGTWVTQTITSSWALYTVTQTLSAGASTPGIRIVTSGDEVYAWGADLRSANDTIYPYQRIEAATVYDSDTSKFPLYLAFDGSDDSLYTAANLDLSATDKVTVFAGVTKLSDFTGGVVAELSADPNSNNGVFSSFAPGSAAPRFDFLSKGTTARVPGVNAAAYAAPITRVFTGIGDISGDVASLRLDGVTLDTNTGDQGTGNYGTYPLFVGARNNASIRLNGRLQQLIVRGAASSAAEISSTERYIAGKQGRAL
jgi:hypothetical protein